MKLKVWQKSMMLVKVIYRETTSFPREEIYGLTSQMRRAAVSVPSNIAEGSQRSSDKDFAHFLLIARGSIAELQTQILLASELGYLEENAKSVLWKLCEEIAKMTFSFHSKLKANS